MSSAVRAAEPRKRELHPVPDLPPAARLGLSFGGCDGE
jgi:hypothetical protein